jgi:hypothetical protein
MTTAASIDDLPDEVFGYIEPGGTKDAGGKTIPRSLRHFPLQDAAHVRNALARLSQSPFGDKARAKVEAAAKKLGIGKPSGKADFDMKAEALTERKTKLWLDGEMGRRILVVPFSGQLPGGKAGLDLDGEYFDEVSDLYGPADQFPALHASPWRFMDWHHDDNKVPSKVNGGPPLSMKGLIIGEIELDDDPDEFGLWAQWWIRQGQANDQRIGARRAAALQEMGHSIYGSSLAAYRQKADDGHIEVWPVIRHTASTTPRNTHAAIPPLKAILADLNPDAMTKGAMKALLEGYATTSDLLLTSLDAAANPSAPTGDEVAKAGRVLSRKNLDDLRTAIELLSDLQARGLLPSEVEENND